MTDTPSRVYDGTSTTETDMDLEAMKAAFAAKGGKVAVAPEGVAYGVDKEADKAAAKARRAAARAAERARDSEHESECAMEAFHDARMGGASMEVAMDEYNYARNRRRR